LEKKDGRKIEGGEAKNKENAREERKGEGTK
jgi:hypothetical protein